LNEASSLRRIRSFRYIALLSWLGGSLLACSDPTDAEPNAAFWPLDFETRWPEVRDCRLSPAEHDGYSIRVFADPASERAYVDGEYPFAPGAQLVKAEYSDEGCTELARVSGMLKLESGEAPELRDWLWQRADPRGKLSDATPASRCAGCHDGCSSHDYTCTDP